MSEKRRQPRTRKRMTCRLRAGGRESTGVVRDCSRTGLFVQTQGATVRPGERLEIVLMLPGGATLDLRGVAVRKESVPAHLSSVRQGGVGIRLESPPLEWDEIAGHPAGATVGASGTNGGPAASAAAAPAGAAEPQATFRVRATLPGTPRSRVVTQAAATAEDARSQVQQRLGSDWRIESVEAA